MRGKISGSVGGYRVQPIAERDRRIQEAADSLTREYCIIKTGKFTIRIKLK
jgi:hypothetical protein